MTVLLFAPRFCPFVESGRKTQTIRGRRKRPVRPGDPLSLRAWTGSPYRSPQRVLRETECVGVLPVVVDIETGRLVVSVAGVPVAPEGLDAFAWADGFDSAWHMAVYYQENHREPEPRDLIRWRPLA